MTTDESIRLLPSLLPQVRKWIVDTLCAATSEAQPALTVADPALKACVGENFLKRTRVVITNSVPTPPIAD